MKRYLSIALLLFGCNASTSDDLVKFGCLEIPERYVIMGPEDNSAGTFDDSGEILISLFHDEIMENMPEYRKIGRNDFDGVLIYPEPHDMALKSQDILSSRRPENIYFTADIYTPYERLYENRVPKSWLLVERQSSALVWIASCNIIGFNGDITSCMLEANLAGFGVNYSLNNENITLKEKYEDFLQKKITEWNVCEKNRS